MARKIVAEVAQPIYDTDGNLVANVGEQISEAAYDKLASKIAPGAYRLVIVEESDPDTEPEPAPEPLAEQGIVELRAQAKALGVPVDGRWSAARLQQEISNAKSKETA